MKKVLLLSMIGLTLSSSAWSEEQVVQMTFRLKDDTGNAVTGAVVQMNTFERWVPNSEFGKDVRRRVEGMADTNGLVVLQVPSLRGSVKYGVFVNGEYFSNTMKMSIAGTTYYRDMGGSFYFTNSIEGKWQPWNPLVEIELKKVINPIPMYARHLDPWSFKVPAYNTSLGYDLVKSDWLSPHGKGETADFIFRLDCQLGEVTPDKVQYYDAIFSLSFTNEGDGIQEFLAHPREGSALRSPRYAPESGYQTQWVHHAFEHKTGASHEINEEQNFFFRIRTKKDAEGRIISALYGKINDPIIYEIRARGASIQMTYYLNPTPNDRNMEFDPSRNLFRDLKSAEQVKDP